MKIKNIKNLIISATLMIAFIVFTFSITVVDVKPIGPQSSLVGLATINAWVHNLTGTNMALYTITDWASIIAVLIVIGFTVLGLCQLIKRRNLLKVDSNILILGIFYIVVFGSYLFFEFCVVNYRPILINGILEPSYPSSTTMLVMCIMPTAMIQFKQRIKNKSLRHWVNAFCGVFTVLMVISRLLSGVHWFTDIVGGTLLSLSLVMFYFTATTWIDF